MMKKYLLMIAVVLAIVSCKKEKAKETPSTLNVFGTWELTRVHGGLLAPMAVAPGSGDKYVLNSDSTYVRYLNNNVKAQGKYSIRILEVRDSIRFGFIKLTNPEFEDNFQIRSKTILFGTSAADGPTYEYKKIK